MQTYYDNGIRAGITGPGKFRDYDMLESTVPVPARIWESEVVVQARERLGPPPEHSDDRWADPDGGWAAGYDPKSTPFIYSKAKVPASRRGDFEIIDDKPDANGDVVARVCWILLVSLGSLFGALGSVTECFGSSERLMLLLCGEIRLAILIYVDDFLGVTRPKIT